MPAVTVQQVADAAGVSRSTANKILLGELDLFRESTATKVLRAAESLGYRPNMLARGLRQQRTFLIATLLSSVNASLAYELYAGVQSAAAEHQCAPITFSCPDSDHEARAIQLCMDRQVDAILINTAPQTSTPENQALLTKLAGDGLPMIELFGRNLPGTPSIVSDVHDAGYRSTIKLLQAGLERVVYWSPLPFDDTSQPNARNWFALDMFRGYQQAMREAGLSPRIEAADLSTGDAKTDTALAAQARAMLRATPGVQGIVSAGELLADAVSRAILDDPSLAQAGLTQASFMAGRPPLGVTDRRIAIRIPSRQIGRVAAEMALERVQGGQPGDRALPVWIDEG